MKTNIVYVWSSGLEDWEPTNLIPIVDTSKLTFLFTKTFGYGKIHIFKDNLNRFMALYYASKS